jgi:osmotically-inducible protein OsmY
MKTDEQIERDVETELRSCSDMDATDIAVNVRDGVVTLTGYARNYCEKTQAEAAATRVVGVTAVANDIQVRLPACSGLTDPEIARATIEALKSRLPRTWQAIQPVVENRNVILEGTVEWTFERMQAENAILGVVGVREVANRIRVVENMPTAVIKEQIEEAFRSRANLDATHVSVETNGSEVKLTGEVASVAERTAAMAAARATPGVSTVTDELTVRG